MRIFYAHTRETTSHGAYERERRLHAGASAAAEKVFNVPLPLFPSSKEGTGLVSQILDSIFIHIQFAITIYLNF